MSDTDSDFETGATGRKLAECQQQLAEARAALADWPSTQGDDGWMNMARVLDWAQRHAAALKAAREVKP